MPWYGSDVLIQFGINALLLAVLAQGWNIIGGYAGYASFGNSVFYGLGSYGVAIAMVQWHLPFGVGLVFGVVLAIVFAVLLGMPVLRLKGHYFAIATLALSQVMTAIVSNVETGRPQYRAGAAAAATTIRCSTNCRWGWLTIATLTIFWLTRSRFGFGLIAIRENEEGAAVMGVNTTLYKVMAFTLSGIFSALAGGIHAYWITFLDPESAFDISLNVKMIIMAVFGGPGTVLGPIVGALFAVGHFGISVERSDQHRRPVLRLRDCRGGGYHAARAGRYDAALSQVRLALFRRKYSGAPAMTPWTLSWKSAK